MIRTFAFLLLIIAPINSAVFANILLHTVPNPTSGPFPHVPGLNLNALAPGQEFAIAIAVKALVAPIGQDEDGFDIPQTVGAIEFLLHSSGGSYGSEYVNQRHISGSVWRRQVDQDQRSPLPGQVVAGGWFTPGTPLGPLLAFSGRMTYIFLNNTTSRTLGYIGFKASDSPGFFNVNFVDMLTSFPLTIYDGAIQPIPGTQTQGFNYTVVPEPSSALLGGLALAGLAFRRQRS